LKKEPGLQFTAQVKFEASSCCRIQLAGLR